MAARLNSSAPDADEIGDSRVTTHNNSAIPSGFMREAVRFLVKWSDSVTANARHQSEKSPAAQNF
jgi:hypothetical protein